MKLISILVLLLGVSFSQAQTTISAVYFGQTHVQKATDTYFGLVGNREVLIKAHVVNPATPASPVVTATLTASGLPNLVLTLTGPATLPASIPDGLGVVQHSFANTFTGYIPANYVKTGLQVTVNAGIGVNTTITNMKVSAPTKVILTMTDVQYFSDTSSDYAAGIFAEIEAKWPVADLEVRRLGHVVFPELVIPARGGAQAARIKSKAEYTIQTGLSFDGEQAAALVWNSALKRAAGRSGRWSYYYLNVYNANAGGQAGGFAGVGSGTNEGILQHESGHAMSLPHWGDSGSYPYKGAMHGISAPAIYNGTHAGPVWAFDLRTKPGAFIPPTVQAGNVGGKTVGTYKADPMQGGGSGWQESAYQLNHFSDYSVNQMRNYLNGHVVVWNPALNSWAQWNSTTGDYTTLIANDGVQFPTVRDTQVISIMASISGSDPEVTMVYPPIGPYTAGQIRLFDPTVAADRTAAQSIFSPANGSDLCVRVVQGGVTKTYMLAASWVTNQDPYSSGSLVTEAINLPASGGTVTKIELLLTPNVEDVGLPATPQVLYTWAPLTPEPSAFEEVPKAFSSSAIAMKAVKGSLGFGYTGTVEYLFTETTENPGATDSAWQTSPSYTDTGLQAGTPYSYTVSMRAGALTSMTSAAASATTLAAPATKIVTVGATQQFSLVNAEGFQAVTGLGTFDAGAAAKLVVVISTEDGSNSGTGYVYDVRYNGKLMTEAIQEEAGSGNGTAAIFYLDNPGPKGTGTIEVSAENPNGGIGAAYALSNTLAGVAVTNSRTGTAANSVSLTTAGQNSVVIAVLQNSGNTNNAGTPTATAPLIQGSSGSWGTFWGSHASGYQSVASPSSITPTFSTLTGSGYSINIAAAEFPANPPLPNSWSQTAGGAQSWSTALNWDDGVIPNPTSSTTMDFSSVDLLADTALTLGADRTARIWKFGDTSGSQNWTVNAGNTLTLAGTTPTIEVKINTTQLNNLVAGTAGLAKTGVGTLFLNGSNTYTGVTRISAGTLQAATLTNGGSAGNLGAASNVAGNLVLNGGTLRYTGAAVSNDRLFSLQASSSMDASGTGALNLANTGAMGFSGSTADKTLTLTGTNTGANTLAASIGDNLLTVAVGDQDITTGYTSLTKSGAGTWVLSGNNTYSGNTTVSAGILRITSNTALGSSPLVAIGSTRLEIVTDSVLSSSPAISSQAGTFVSDRATPGAGLARIFGNASIGNGLTTFAAGANVTSGTAVIQLANFTNNNGSTATPGLNPTTANLIITGNVTLGVSNTGIANLTLGGTGSVNSIGGAIENGTRATGNVIKSGTSIWSLSGANSYNGTTTITGGTLVYRNLGAKAAGNHAFSGGTTLGLGVATTGSFFTSTDLDNAFTGTMSGSLSNVTVALTTNVGIDTTAGNFTYATSVPGSPTRGLAKLGANTLTLTGNNTYTGPTTISGGTLALGAGNTLPTTAVSIGSATLNAATFSDTVGTLNVTGNATINLGAGASLAFATGSPAWTGTLTLTGTFVSGSSLRFGTTSGGLDSTQLGKISATGFTGFGLTSTGFLTATAIGATTYTITNTTSDANGTCTPTGGTSVVSGDSQTYILTPGPGYAVATLAVNGVPVTPALSYTFSNVSANQTISATFVSLPSSTLYWDSDSAIPGFGDAAGIWGTTPFWTTDASGTSTPLPLITATNSSVNFGTATLNYDNAAVAVAAGGVNAGNITFGAGQTTALTLSGGNITLGSAAVITVNNAANTIDSALTGAGTSLTKAGTGSLTLSAANTYSGTTAIATGTLRLGADNVLPDGSGAGNVDVTGTLDLNTFSETINGLSGVGTVDTVAGDAPTLTLGGGNASSTFSGTITNTTGTLNLVKTGSGAVIFTGANSYSGLTTISGGTLQIGAGGTTGSIDSTTGITNAAALIYNRSNNLTVAYNISGNGTLNKQGAGVLTLAGNNDYTGQTTVSAGTLRLANANAMGSTSGITIVGTSSVLQLATDVASTGIPSLAHGYSSSSQATIVSDRLTSNSAGITYALGDLNLGTVQINFTAGTNVNSTLGTAGVSFNNVTPGGTSATTTTTLNPTTANLIILGSVTPTGTNTNTLILTGTSLGSRIDGAISTGNRTTQSVSKTNTSTWTLSGTNTYNGTTSVTGGLLITTKAAALPGFNTAAKVVFNGGTLGAQVGGSGWTTTEVDTLLASATKTSGALGIDTTNSNLTQWTAFTTTNLGPSLGLTKLGANTLTLNQANTYAGNTTITAGTLALGAGNVLPATVLSLGSAMLNAATFADTLGTLDVTGSAVINLGTGAALTFADSSGISWTGGTLNITGTFVSGSSLKFGTSATALTATQLALITKPGGGALALNSSGFLIDALLSGYAAWAATNATSSTPAQDQDNDGVSNAVEFVLGGSSTANDLSKLPALTTAGGNMNFSFKRVQSSISANTSLAIQVGTNLSTWPTSYNVGINTTASSAGVTVQQSVPAGFDTITLSVPQAPDSQKFIRLNVTITP